MKLLMLVAVVSGMVWVVNSTGFCVHALPQTASAAQENTARQVAAYGDWPLGFEVNNGQFEADLKFLGRGKGYGVCLNATEAIVALQTPNSPKSSTHLEGRSGQGGPRQRPLVMLRLKLAGANPNAVLLGARTLCGGAV
jgi:hypothetical protein